MTFYEAAEVAKKAEVAEMWLTHFSPSLVHAEDYMPQVREIFPNAFLGKDGKSVELMFEDEKIERGIHMKRMDRKSFCSCMCCDHCGTFLVYYGEKGKFGRK